MTSVHVETGPADGPVPSPIALLWGIGIEPLGASMTASIWPRDGWRRSRGVVALLTSALVLTLAPLAPVAAATAEIRAGDADHVFTFVDDVVGQKPSYVSLPWQQTDVRVIDSDWALDGKALQISPYASNAFFAAVFDGVPARVNTEVLLRFRDTGPSSTSHWMTGAGARIQGAAGSATGVLTQTRAGTNPLVLARVTDGLFERSEFPVAASNYLRTRWVDGVVSAKVWGGSLAEEPAAWSVADHVLSSPTTAAGGVGITRFFAGHTTEVDYVAIDELPDPEKQPTADLRIMPVGDSITAGSTNAVGPQATYRMFLYDHLLASGLAAGTDLDFVGPYDTHPSTRYDYLRQGEWDHDSLSASGWRTTDALREIGPAVSTHDPEVLLILLGINDLRAGTDPAVVSDRMDQILFRARAERPDIKVLMAEIPPTTLFWGENAARIESYNALLRGLASTRTTTASPVQTVDMYTDFDPDVHHYDGLHPNATGEELIASRWADALHTSFGIGDPWDPDAAGPGPDPTPDPGPGPDPDPDTPRFSDIAGTEHAEAIVRMADLGVAFGFADGTYRPGDPVRRGQMASLLQRVLGLPDGDVTAFEDVAGTTHAGAIGAISEAGIALGYNDGTFRPDASVTRGQMASFLERAFQLPPGDAGVFSDALGTTHSDAIGAVAAAEVAFGFADGSFRPAGIVTRGQMASFLDRALER